MIVVNDLRGWINQFPASGPTGKHSYSSPLGLGGVAAKFGVSISYTPTVFMIDPTGQVIGNPDSSIPSNFKELCKSGPSPSPSPSPPPPSPSPTPPPQVLSIDTVDVIGPNGPGSGPWEPGDKLQIDVTITNKGSASVSGITGQIALSDNRFATVDTGTIQWDPLNAGSSAKGRQPAVVTILSSAPSGSTFKVLITVTGGGATVAADREISIAGTPPSGTYVYNGGGLPLATVDNATVHSALSVNGAPWTGGVKILQAAVLLDIKHDYIGDLVVNLVAPDGKTFNLFTGSGPGQLLHIEQDMSPTLKGIAAEGSWQLDVQDRYPMDEGVVNAVQLKLTPDVRPIH